MLPNLKETFAGRFLCLYSRYDKIKVVVTKLAFKYNVTKLGFWNMSGHFSGTLDVYEKNGIYYPKIFYNFLVFGCM